MFGSVHVIGKPLQVVALLGPAPKSAPKSAPRSAPKSARDAEAGVAGHRVRPARRPPPGCRPTRAGRAAWRQGREVDRHRRRHRGLGAIAEKAWTNAHGGAARCLDRDRQSRSQPSLRHQQASGRKEGRHACGRRWGSKRLDLVRSSPIAPRLTPPGDRPRAST